MKSLFLIFFTLGAISSFANDKKTELRPITLTNNLKVTQYGNLFFGGQPTEEQVAYLKKQGFATVISLRTEKENTGFDEPKIAKANGLNFVRVPVDGAGSLTPQKADEITQTIVKHRSQGKVLVHCASGGRVGLWAGLHFFKDHKYSEKAALDVAHKIGMPEQLNKQLTNSLNTITHAK